MSKQYKKNFLGCFVALLGLQLFLFGGLLLIGGKIDGWYFLGSGLVLYLAPFLWAKNISYDANGNEVLSTTISEDIANKLSQKKEK